MTRDTLDRLEAEWQALDRQGAGQEDDLVQPRRGSRLRSVRRRLWPFAAGQTLQILVAMALIVPSYAVATRADAGMPDVGAALLMLAYGAVAIAWAIATLVMIGRLDPALPVFHVQERLLRLRRTHLLGSFVLGLGWWLLWLPFLATLAAWRGADGYMDHLAPAIPWLLAASLAGFAGTLAAAALARGRPLLRNRLLKLMSGGRLLEVEEELRSIVQMRREGTAA